MTTNASGKLNMNGAVAIQNITAIPPNLWSEKQRLYIDACLTALAHQPERWYSYQNWGEDGPVAFLANRGINFTPVTDPQPEGRSWYSGCNCEAPHWSFLESKEPWQKLAESIRDDLGPEDFARFVSYAMRLAKEAQHASPSPQAT